MYRALRGVLLLAIAIFYRRRNLGGVIPPGPVLLVSNHPNGLVDPLLLLSLSTRPLRFLAKSTLFKMPVVGWMTRTLRCLPVFRAQDGASTRDNLRTFTVVHEALAQGSLVCLFPEGISHDEPQLQPLKTGAARMALGAQVRVGQGAPVRVVPAGLVYRDKRVFRSEVALQVGEPIDVAALIAQHGEGGRAVKVLNAAIDRGIRSLTVNLDTWDDLPLLELAARVCWPEVEPLDHLAALSAGMRRIAQEDPPRVDALRTRLRAFRDDLAALGLDPAHLDSRYATATVLRFAARNLFALTFGLLVTVVGVVAWIVPYRLIDLIVKKTKPDPDIESTYKVLGGMLFFPLFYAAWIVAAALTLGPWWALLVAALLPPAGLYAEHFQRMRVEAWREVRIWRAAPRQAEARARLRAERDALAAEVAEVARRVGALPPVPEPVVADESA